MMELFNLAITDGLPLASLTNGFLAYFYPLFAVQEGSGPFGIDGSIEGMKSQEFSVGIFYFLIICIVVFTVFVFLFMFKSKAVKLKTGEKILFAWILVGIFVAVIFAGAQMLHGYLF
jgi:hypothetical protein